MRKCGISRQFFVSNFFLLTISIIFILFRAGERVCNSELCYGARGPEGPMRASGWGGAQESPYGLMRAPQGGSEKKVKKNKKIKKELYLYYAQTCCIL
jgi:hypothetical protein